MEGTDRLTDWLTRFDLFMVAAWRDFTKTRVKKKKLCSTTEHEMCRFLLAVPVFTGINGTCAWTKTVYLRITEQQYHSLGQLCECKSNVHSAFNLQRTHREASEDHSVSGGQCFSVYIRIVYCTITQAVSDLNGVWHVRRRLRLDCLICLSA